MYFPLGVFYECDSYIDISQSISAKYVKGFIQLKICATKSDLLWHFLAISPSAEFLEFFLRNSDPFRIWPNKMHKIIGIGFFQEMLSIKLIV